MAHFAKLDENNNVIGVHVVKNDVITVDGTESEQAGIDFLTALYGHALWKQTSYNNNFRKNFAAVGFKYDVARDAFLFPQPYPSWVLDEETCKWEAPVERPELVEGTLIKWDETTTSWIVTVAE
jgi:hypothetical protein